MNVTSPLRLKDLLLEARTAAAIVGRVIALARELGWGRAVSKRGLDAARQAQAALEPVRGLKGGALIPVLINLLARNGEQTNPQGLTAALPMEGEDLDPRVAPLALARFRMQARWERRKLHDLTADDFPCVLRLREGTYVLALDFVGDESIRVAAIDRGVDSNALTALEGLALEYAGEALLVGSIDPVNGDVEAEERDQMRAFPKRWILGRFLEDKRMLGQLLLAAVLLNLCSLAMPMYQRAVYDRVVPNLAMESLWAISIGMVIALSFEFLLRTIKSDFVEGVGLRVSHLVQHKVIAGLMAARHDRSPTSKGSVLVALRDVDSLAHLAPLAIVTFLVDLPFFFIFLALLWSIGGPVVLVALVGALAIAFSGVIAASGLGRMGERSSNLSRARSNQVVDAVDGLQTLKTNQAEGRFLKEWSTVSDHMAISGHALRQWGEWSGSITALIVQVVTILVLVVGVYQMQEGLMTIGTLIACSLMAGRAMTPISTATAILARAHQALAQFSGLAELIALTPEKDVAASSISGRKLKVGIEFRRVTFAYEQDAPPALIDLSVKIKAGERVALIGKSGSGKSTFLQLAAGLVEPSQGRMLFDDFAADQYGVSRIRAAISYASQDAIIFDASLKDNIVLGAPYADDDDLIAAVTISGVDQLAATLPNGFGARLGQRGAKLSGGQRQAVILARALARRCPILLLDEPTSALDAVAEARVREGIAKLPRDITMIMSTHRLELLSLVDRVIWLEAGRVVADQPTNEVMARLRSVGVVRAGA